MISRIEDYNFFIGMDPAKVNDYFGVCVHAVSRVAQPNGEFDVKLAYLTQLQANSYVTILKELRNGVLKKYGRFVSLDIDSTGEKALSDQLAYQYGEDRVNRVIFSGGESGSKANMMKTSKQFLSSGYKLPPSPKPGEHMTVAMQYLEDLKRQLNSEEFKISPSGSISFDHSGPHNDLLHAWILSLSGCHRYIIARLNNDGSHVVGSLGKNRKGAGRLGGPRSSLPSRRGDYQ